MLNFADDELSPSEIRGRFTKALHDFAPHAVIITDSWNTKPLLAEAARDYPFFLRLQARECLCPLNNLQLLPGGVRCPSHQLASAETCRACILQHGATSGTLHQAERRIAGVGSAEHDKRLRWALRTRTLRSTKRSPGRIPSFWKTFSASGMS